MSETEAPKESCHSFAGGMVKKGTGDEVKVRPLCDGTHNMLVHENVRVCDRERPPFAPDIQRALRQNQGKVEYLWA